MVQRGCRHKEIARVLNVSMKNVHIIRKIYLPNVNCSHEGRLQLLNTKMECHMCFKL